MEGAFQANAFQNDAFQVIVVRYVAGARTLGTGIGGVRDRKGKKAIQGAKHLRAPKGIGGVRGLTGG